jgi:phosphoribosyl-AMP cyclohydrolase
LPIIIYQDITSKHIFKLEESDQFPKESYEIDCDEDSILIKGSFPIYPHQILYNVNITSNYLLPVVTLDKEGVVLMQAFLNKESLNLSFQSGFAHYYSRSRKRLWKKGEESGHLQTILSVSFSTEFNFYLYKVSQNSNACHTGAYSCFYRKVENGIVSFQ